MYRMIHQHQPIHLITVILILVHHPLSIYCLSITVSNTGIDLNECLSGNDHVLNPLPPPCRTLDFIANRSSTLPGKDVVITITSHRVTLRSIFMLQHMRNFTLQGMRGQLTSITCISAGFQFINISGLILRNIEAENCGAMEVNTSHTGHVYSNVSFIIIESSNISLTDLVVRNSLGHGAVIMNSQAEVRIGNCSFIDNGILEKAIGLLIIADLPASGNRNITATYEISNCIFNRSAASSTNDSKGMAVKFSTSAYNNKMRIADCKFDNNEGYFGAALYIMCSSQSTNNFINVTRTNFTNNTAAGGGAIFINFSIDRSRYGRSLNFHDSLPKKNLIIFSSCHIFRNTAKTFGGGVAISSDSVIRISNQYRINHIYFTGTSFFENEAKFGAAVAINLSHKYTGNYFMILNKFIDCKFYHNSAGNFATDTMKKISQSGVFFSSKLFVYFGGKIRFEGNRGTSLYISSTTVRFMNGSEVYFNNNIGGTSGGILLANQAFMKLNENSHLIFENNKGAFGAGICSLVLEHFQYNDQCFMKLAHQYDHKYNVQSSLTFINNEASTGIGHDIFVTNLKPCLLNQSVSSFFNNFNFTSPVNSSRYATATDHITMSNNKTIQAMPGIPINLNITQHDQFGQNVGKLFPLSAIILDSSNITVDSNYAYVINNEIIFRGKPGSSAGLILQSNIIAVVNIYLNVKMTTICPPGFFYSESQTSCICTLNQFISKCNIRHAFVKEGHWIGWLEDGNETTVVIGGVCEYRLCQYNRSLIIFGSYRLPTDPQKLEQFVCGKYRQGRLCGRCAPNFTVHYNSPTFRCGKVEGQCQYGLVFYFLSEIVPITILFLVIIIFNIHLTSGSLYSFIFFAQTLDILYVDAFGSIHYKGFVKTAFNILRIFYSATNLKFFMFEKWSFCLFKNMTVMDVFIAQYIPLVYALLLIFATLLILKVNSLYTCIKLCHKCGRRNIRGSVINGLTAFIVLCYFKCVDLTCSILIPVTIVPTNKTVPLFNGELDYMKGEHWNYVTPAFICLIVIILPPPVLLLFESVTMTINRSCRIRRNCFTYFLHRIRMKAMPFLDSFQGCFKDDRRYFAGLFFAYKVLLLSPYTVTAYISYDFLFAEVMLFGILILHISCRPFQKSWHNIVDCGLLVNLLLINTLTMNEFNSKQLFLEYRLFDTLFQILQLLCVAFPMVYLAMVMVYKINARYDIKSWLIKNVVKSSRASFLSQSLVASAFNNIDEEVDPLNDESLPFRLIESENNYRSLD